MNLPLGVKIPSEIVWVKSRGEKKQVTGKKQKMETPDAK